MTAPLVFSLIAFFAACAAVAAVVILRKPSADPVLPLLQQQMEGLRAQLSESLAAQARLMAQQMDSVSRQVGESQKSVGDRLDAASRVVGEVQRSLGELGQASQRIFEVGKDISGLQDLLRSPKLRGGLGEYFLGDLLGQILPARHFSLQHAFKSGVVVDAAVHLGDRLVPVDAKFPLENFRRWAETGAEDERRALRKKFAADVKKHVDAIAAKYILPDEGTYDFALMYIPAENVYYECIVKPEDAGEAPLLEHALSRRVIPVSPSSFYAYLQALVLGLKGLKVEENARRILDGLGRIQGDVKRFSEEFDLLGRHLSNAHTKHEDASRRLAQLQDKLTTTASGGEAALEQTPPLPSLPK